MKSIVIIAVAVVMIGVMIPNVFAANPVFESQELGVTFSAPVGWSLQQPEKTSENSPDVVAAGPKIDGINPYISLTVKDAKGKTIDDLILKNNNVLAEAVHLNILEILSQEKIKTNIYQTEAISNFEVDDKTVQIKFLEIIILSEQKSYTFAYSNSIDHFDNHASQFQESLDSFRILSQESSIYEAVGLEEPLGIASFVDQTKDPQHYIDRYNNESTYKEWFDDNYSQYSSIYEAVGLEEPVAEYTPEPITEVTSTPNCGTGTIEKDGICVAELKNTSKIKLIPGQWIEYTIDIEIDGTRTLEAMFDKVMKDGVEDLGYDITKVTKLRIEVLKVTDTYVEIERILTMIDDEITTKEKIDISVGPIGTPLFGQPFIELPFPSTVKPSGDENNPFFIESINLEGEKKLTINNQKIPVFFYRGFTTYDYGENIETKDVNMMEMTSLAEYYFEKNTGILVKSTTEMTMFGFVEPLGELDIGISFIQSMTDYHIPKEKSSKGGGCLIATATYGSEMANEVQQLRELRDNQLLQTESGTQFMSTFNDIYYSFSPTIADMERENPYFKEAVKLAITPMISTLSLMENAESDSEVLGIGISVIALNLGMYLGVPAIVVIGIRKKF